ncbi:pilin [Amycolatopsis sp. La24]|uniref:pilin n=1 Tax=Amycolatopsis sp. La24 TaxID=3028304 RepID=UPI0023B00C0D|nr:pilin [Amycolatopsis sp. La24]
MRLIDYVQGKVTALRSAHAGCSLGDRDLARLPGPPPKDQITAGGRRWAPRLLWQARAVLVAEIVGVALVLSASTAHADTVVVALATSFTDILSNIQKWVMGILAGLATLFMTIGASRYMWGNNEPSEIAKAKAAVKAAAFGYCLALLVPLILEILKGFVGAQ